MNTTHSNCNGIWFIAMALTKKNGLDKAAKAQSQIVLSHVLTICQLECKSKEVGLDRSG